MSLTYVSPYVETSGTAQNNVPMNVTYNAQKTTDCLHKNITDGSPQNTDCVTNGNADERNLDVEVDGGILPDLNEPNTISTASTSSEASTTISRSQSPISSIEDDCANEDVNQSEKDIIHEQCIGRESHPSPEMVSVTQIDSVFARDLPGLSSTVIGAPVRYVGSMPGKKIRDKAASALNIWLQVNADDLKQIRQVINRLHNASLILDDVEDGSMSRRGRPATHTVFGIPQAINSAGYQINKAMIEVLKLGNSQCVEIFTEEMDKLYVGQGYDLFWTFNIKRPSVEEYISMVDYKTGALFNMLVRLMIAKNQMINSTITPDLNRLVVLLGRYFQIRDDYMNLTSTEYTDQKGFCEDLDEGKFSLTLIHALENAAEDAYSIVKHILAQRHISNGMSLAQKHLVLDILKETGSLEYTVTALREIGQKIDCEIHRIENVTGIENKPLRALFEVLKI